jgi:hypothetical protein
METVAPEFRSNVMLGVLHIGSMSEREKLGHEGQATDEGQEYFENEKID